MRAGKLPRYVLYRFFRLTKFGLVAGDGMYQLWNDTDKILAAPDSFETKEQALECAKKLRKRFVVQGFYLSAEGRRIAPEDVRLLVIPADA